MIGTEIVSLLQIARELVSRKAELDRDYFKDFIEPTWNAFVRVHEAYKTAFAKYMESTSRDDMQVESLLEAIRQDYIYSKDLRSELSKLIKNIPTARFKTKEEHIANFAASIIDYFDFGLRAQVSHALNRRLVGRKAGDDSYPTIELKTMPPPSYRSAEEALCDMQIFCFTSIQISIQGRDADRREVRSLLERIVKDLQNHFDKVAGSYYRLRKELLT